MLQFFEFSRWRPTAILDLFGAISTTNSEYLGVSVTLQMMCDVCRCVCVCVCVWRAGNLDRHHYYTFDDFGNYTAPVLTDNGRGWVLVPSLMTTEYWVLTSCSARLSYSDVASLDCGSWMHWFSQFFHYRMLSTISSLHDSHWPQWPHHRLLTVKSHSFHIETSFLSFYEINNRGFSLKPL